MRATWARKHETQGRMTVPYLKQINKGNRNVCEQRGMKQYQQIKTQCTFEDKSTKVVHEPTKLLTVPIRKNLEGQKRSTTKGTPHCTSWHITTTNQQLWVNHKKRIRDAGNLEPYTHIHTYTARYTVLLIITGVETPRWKKHQGLSDGLNCVCTAGWVSVHVNPCHVITSRSAANSVAATTCVAVQLRCNTTDLTKLYYGRSPPPTHTHILLSAVGKLRIVRDL